MEMKVSDKRKQTIDTLTELLNHWKRLLSEGICCEVEGKQTINALTFAIESIKVDRAYDLAYEKVDFIEIPEGASNGDMIKAMFPKCRVWQDNEGFIGFIPKDDCTKWFRESWWNSPYRKEN